MKVLFLILVFLSIGILFFVFGGKHILEKEIFVSSLSRSLDNSNIKDKDKEEDSEIILFAVGDIMLDRGIEYMVEKQGKGDWNFPFLNIVDYLKQADILFGNLESVISDKGQKVGSIYSFRANPESLNGLIYAGFDVVSVANNHIFDYGRIAMEDSLTRLEESGIGYVGAGFSKQETHSVLTKEIKETKIGFLAYTNSGSKSWQAEEDSSGIAWLDETIAYDIKKAKQEVDILVVSMHFGNEYQIEPSAEQKYFAHLAIDSGADLVLGHHPHVIQAVEEYENGFIAFSLGNFIFDQGFSEQTLEGLLLKVLINDKKIKEVVSIKVEMNEFFQPSVSALNK